jgi:sugar phosphate isomerase/epimerase
MKIGMMNNPSLSVYDEIAAIGTAKFDFVDLTIEGPNLYFDAERVRGLLDHHNLKVVGHTDPCLPYAYPVDGIREACLVELERCAKLFSELGAKLMNIHPCYASPPCRKQDLLAMNIEALKVIEQMSRGYGLTLVLENFRPPFDRVDNFKTILSEIPALGLHLDFGHTNIGRDDGDVFCKHLGSSVEHVHFSDNRSMDDLHMPLGVGNVNWKKMVSALKKIGYDGTITLEIFCDDSTVLFDYLEISKRLLLRLWNG